MQYDINREAGNISALSSCKIDKYEYLTADDILTSNQKQIIEQAYLLYFGKSFWKQTKINEDLGKKQIDALKNLKTNTQEVTIKYMIQEVVLNDEDKNELNKIKKSCRQKI